MKIGKDQTNRTVLKNRCVLFFKIGTGKTYTNRKGPLRVVLVGSPPYSTYVKSAGNYVGGDTPPLGDPPLRNYVRGGDQEWSGGAPGRVVAPVPWSRADALER